MNKKILIVILIVILSLVLISAFFYPKQRVFGGRGGPIAINGKVYLEEYSCFGIKYNFCPNWPDYGCDLLCYGLVFDKKCYNETYEDGGKHTKMPISCK